MKSINTVLILVISFLFVLSPIKSHANTSDEYVVTAGKEQITFVRRPELGYVVVSQEETTAIETLDTTLRGFGTEDIRPIKGLGRRDMSVVFSQRSASENENTIKTLKAQSQIKYASPLFSSNETLVAIIPEIVVRLREKSDDGQLQDLCQSINVRIKHKLQFTKREYLVEVLTADASGVFSAVEQVNQAAFVEWAVPNVAFRPKLLGQVIPNDTYFPNQWHLNNTGQSGGTPNADINTPEAWEITTGDPNIIVAVLDEGVDTNHPDLTDNIVAGYDFLDDDSNPNPSGNDAHGTACAGLIAGRGSNGLGITGVAWNCKIMPIRIAGNDGSFVTETEIATAFRWAANNGADILSNSWGNTSTLSTIHSAIIDVTKRGRIGREGKGCVVLAAAGNTGGSIVYPAKYAEVIAVGATNKDDIRWSYSAHGIELDIVAPSGNTNLNGDIWTTDIAGAAGYNNRNPSILDYTDRMGGTSAACPIAAGVAALILSIEPNFSNIDVQDILQDSSLALSSVGYSTYYGYGRVDANGAMELAQTVPFVHWLERYTGDHDSACDIAVDSSGNVYVSGYSDNGSSSRGYATIKYDPNGNLLWLRFYNGLGHDYAQALTVDDLGNVYVTGYSPGSGTEEDYATIKYDTNGVELWASRYDGPPGNKDERAYAVAVDGSGNVYVTGQSYGNDASREDYATIKYDPNGNELWVKRYNGPGDSPDSAEDLDIDGCGNIYVTGSSYGSGTGRDYATVKYSPDGNELWVARYNGPGNGSDYARALTIDSTGNIYVTGGSTGSGTGSDYATIKYDSNGVELWVSRYDGPPGNENDSSGDVAVDSSGNVYVTGSSYGIGTQEDYATIKYDPNGIELWVKRYNGPEDGPEDARELALDSLGNVYVTGDSAEIAPDYATIKYDTNGNQLWLKRYNGLGNGSDYARSLAVDDSHNVYVTGMSSGGDTSLDYVTIKYKQRNYCTAVLDGDLDGNCKVDFLDYAILAEDWLVGKDWMDLVVIAEDWLECKLAYQGACW